MKDFDDLKFENHPVYEALREERRTDEEWPPNRALTHLAEMTEDNPPRCARLLFPNGWGVSVICGFIAMGGSEGLYEVGILWRGDLHGDPIGYLTPEKVSEVMRELQWSGDPDGKPEPLDQPKVPPKRRIRVRK